MFGRLGSGNIGNDATLDVLMRHLRARHPDAVVDFMCSGPESMRSRYGVDARHLHWFHSGASTSRPRTLARIAAGAVTDAWRTAAWVRRHDAVIVPGMGSLESTLQERPWQMPWSLFLLSLSGRLFGVRVAFACVGASRIPEPANRRLMVTAARLAHYRSFRDAASRQALVLMGLDCAADPVYPDLVLALSGPTGHRTGGPPTVGIGVMAFRGSNAERARSVEIHSSYVQAMVRVVTALLDAGLDIRLVIGDAEDDETALAILDLVRGERPANGDRVRYAPATSYDDVLAQLAETDVVAAARYHNVIAGLALHKPTVAIAYGDKHGAVLEQMGVPDLVQPIRDLDTDLLVSRLCRLARQPDDVSEVLRRHHDVNRMAVERQLEELDAVLFGGTRAVTGPRDPARA
jgi:polysaccharide pyruvyl transferase WcaK-like protein